MREELIEREPLVLVHRSRKRGDVAGVTLAVVGGRRLDRAGVPLHLDRPQGRDVGRGDRHAATPGEIGDGDLRAAGNQHPQRRAPGQNLETPSPRRLGPGVVVDGADDQRARRLEQFDDLGVDQNLRSLVLGKKFLAFAHAPFRSGSPAGPP